MDRWQAEVEVQRALDSARLLWARFVARNRSDLVRRCVQELQIYLSAGIASRTLTLAL